VSVTRKLTLAGRQSGRRPRASGRQLDNGGSNGCGTRARESARSPLHSSGRPDRCEWQNGGNAERHMGRCLWDGSPWGVHNFVDAPPTCPELVGVPGLPDVCGTPTGAAKVWDSHDHRKSVGLPRPPQKCGSPTAAAKSVRVCGAWHARMAKSDDTLVRVMLWRTTDCAHGGGNNTHGQYAEGKWWGVANKRTFRSPTASAVPESDVNLRCLYTRWRTQQAVRRCTARMNTLCRVCGF
jgi:hypothetical protein